MPVIIKQQVCNDAYLQLSEVQAFQAAFDAALSDALISGEFLELEKLEQQLETALVSLEGALKSLESNPLYVIRGLEQKLNLQEGALHYIPLEVGGMTTEELITAIESTPEVLGATRIMMQINDYTKSMLRNTREFLPTTEKQQMHFVRLTVADLGFLDGATTQEIFAKAQELGLELCPPDAGPHLRLHYTDQSMNEFVFMGMQPISDSDGFPDLFVVERDRNGTWLCNALAGLGKSWDAEFMFVFRISQPQVVEV